MQLNLIQIQMRYYSRILKHGSVSNIRRRK